MVQGNYLQSHDKMVDTLHAFFVQLVGKLVSRQHSIDLDYLNVSSHDLASLEAPFSEEEIWDVVKSFPSEKAPGLDGFIALFYQKGWDIITGDILAAFFHQDHSMGNDFDWLNQALITLLPKKLRCKNRRISDLSACCTALLNSSQRCYPGGSHLSVPR